MNSPISIFRFVLLALAGALLAGYGFSYQISIHPGAESFRRLLDSMPTFKALLSFPPGIFVALCGLATLTIAVHRLRAVWLIHQILTRRRTISVPTVNEHDEHSGRCHPGTPYDRQEPDWEGEEYVPGPSYVPSHYDPRRGNGQYEPRQIEAYR